MKPILIIIILFLILAASVALTVYFSDAILVAEPYARYSLVLSALFTLMLGISFWYLQKRDSDAIEELARNMHKHIEQQQQIQDSIRVNSFNNIRLNLKQAITTIERIIREVEKKQTRTTDLVATAQYLDHLLVIYHSLNPPIVNILQQLIILRPYIRGDFASKIESMTDTIKYTGLSSKDKSEGGRIFAIESPDTALQWLKFASETFEKIDKLNKEIEDYKP